MTRINVIPPDRLTDAHLLAEYRELPRIFALARPDPKAPSRYTLGAGHVRFFYSRTRWLSRRQAELIAELVARGFSPTHTTPPPPVPGLDGDWEPDDEAAGLNLARLRERLHERPGWYRWRGAVVGPDFYGV